MAQLISKGNKLRETKLLSIMRIIHKALDEELDNEDLDILNDSIKKLKTVKHSYATYQYDSEKILANSETIINAVTSLYKNTHYCVM